MSKSLILNKIKKHYKFKTDAEFARFLEIKPQTLSSWYSRDTMDYELLSAKCVGIDANFLLTGTGEMLKSEVQHVTKKNLIPLYDDVATIGGSNVVANMDGVSTPSEYIDTGDWFKDATAAVRHYCDSMIEYPSGCILALKEVKDRNLIVFGKNYVIETSEYRITKRLQTGSGNILMAYSTNNETYPDGKPVHEPIPVPREAISRIFLVLGYVVKQNGGTLMFNIA